MGINSDLQPVLSFPLGSNVVSLLEATRMYETLVTGKLTTYGPGGAAGGNDSLQIIDSIESEDGKVLYRPRRHQIKVVGDKERIAVDHILENVVKFGTGRQADHQVRLHDGEAGDSEIDALNLPVPLLGKTGTANRYTNAAFFGYLPTPSHRSETMELASGYTVGVYVGYDDNAPMRNGTIRITGAAGALPAWIGIVNSLVGRKGYTAGMDPVDLSFSGLHIKWDPKGELNLAVDPDNGGSLILPPKKVDSGNRYQPSILTFGTVTPGGRFLPERDYRPFWRVSQGGR